MMEPNTCQCGCKRFVTVGMGASLLNTQIGLPDGTIIEGQDGSLTIDTVLPDEVTGCGVYIERRDGLICIAIDICVRCHRIQGSHADNCSKQTHADEIAELRAAGATPLEDAPDGEWPKRAP